MIVKKLSTAILVSALAAGTLLPTYAAATSHSAVSDGRLNVEAGTLDPTDPIIDPENPGESIDPNNPEITPGENPGSLGITNVSRLNFGTIKTATKAVKTYAEPLVVGTDSGGNDILRGALVQFGDTRGTNEGYTVTAAMTRQFTFYTLDTNNDLVFDGTKTLAGSTITYTNGIMETRADNMAQPGTMSTSLTPISFGDSIDVVTATQNQGAGTYILEFGQSANYDGSNTVTGMTGVADSADSSVILDVPAATASSMTLGTYSADITWTITAGPTTPTP
ncbi:WxL domain-containing protein [Enterococcus sp. LJL120]